MCRVYKQHYGDKEDWHFQYGKNHPILVTSVMGIVNIVAIIAHAQGVKETQDKLHDALGLSRLVDAVVDAATRDRDY